MAPQFDSISRLYKARSRWREIRWDQSLDLQTPAPLHHMYFLRRSSPTQYHFVHAYPTANPTIPRPDGLFYFVIRSDVPYEVVCGVVGSNQPECGAISGHTSLSYGSNVMAAGDLYLNNGTLVHWTNSSGHYLPPARYVLRNRMPHIKLLLPEELFFDIAPPAES